MRRLFESGVWYSNLKLFKQVQWGPFDDPNYSRYLVWLEVFLSNIDLSHAGTKELPEKGGVAVAWSRCTQCSRPDHGGDIYEVLQVGRRSIAGLFSMFGVYQRRCRITSARAQYFEMMLEMCGLIDDPECPKAGKHRELKAAEIKKSEEAVQRTIKTFTDPFAITDKETISHLVLLFLQRSKLMSLELVRKPRRFSSVIASRMGHPKKPSLNPSRDRSLKQWRPLQSREWITSSQGKLIQYREQSNLAFMLPTNSQLLDEPLNLDELMRYTSPDQHEELDYSCRVGGKLGLDGKLFIFFHHLSEHLASHYIH